MLLTLNPSASPLAERLGLIIQGICQAAARRGAKDWSKSALILLVWGRLQRMSRRFEALVARARAGQLPSKPQIPRTRPPRPPTPTRANLPRGFAWLIRLVPEAAVYGCQLQYLLTDPETAALLKAAPHAGRILRPLCRMLGVRPGPAALPASNQIAPAQPPPPRPAADPTEPPLPARPRHFAPRPYDENQPGRSDDPAAST